MPEDNSTEEVVDLSNYYTKTNTDSEQQTNLPPSIVLQNDSGNGHLNALLKNRRLLIVIILIIILAVAQLYIIYLGQSPKPITKQSTTKPLIKTKPRPNPYK